MTDQLITFPQFVMENLFEPGDNRQHLVERAIATLWAHNKCFHPFEVQFIDQLGTFEAVWISMPEESWSAWIAHLQQSTDAEAQEVITELEELLKRNDGMSHE